MTRFINFLVLLALSTTLAIAEIPLAPSCGEVTMAVAPCLTFLKGAETPSPGCCSGAQKLAKQASTKADREAVCGCLKNSLSKIGSYDPQRVPLIAKKCGVNMNIPPITSKTDCST
ncbi:Plant lipid transfer protein/Par allergen [Corchorus capsularis]|uniref:Non-specific lipid-transfer protein n=1 Tax=Corchorus capsularis TaxID=210143 RepID=A0A1R3H224_COCAP|nr:Plant lipid transfer protein/Par allergen [Corchorus capsularis]